MKNHTKAIIICSIVSLIGAIVYISIKMNGVSYTPWIDPNKLSSLSYDDAIKLIDSKKTILSTADFLSHYVTTLWFWGDLLKLWLVLFISSYSAIFINNRWQRAK